MSRQIISAKRKKWTIQEILVRDGQWPTVDGPRISVSSVKEEPVITVKELAEEFGQVTVIENTEE